MSSPPSTSPTPSHRDDWQCKLLLMIVVDPVFLASMGAKVVAAAVGIVMLVFTTYYETVTKIIHPNARFIIRSHFYIVIVSGVAIVAINGIDFVRLIRYKTGHVDSACDIVPLPAWVGGVCQLLLIIGNNNSTTFLTALAIERTIATVKAKSYEKWRTSKVGKLLSILALVVNIPLIAWIFGTNDYSETTPLTTTTASSFEAGGMCIRIMTAFELAGLVAFLTLFLINVRRRRAQSRLGASLAYKYQVQLNRQVQGPSWALGLVQENVIGYEMIFPIAFLHCASYTVTYLIIMVAATILTGNSASDGLAVTRLLSVYDFTVAYVVLLPFLMIYKTVRKAKKPAKVFITAPREQQIANEANHYFAMLNAQLN
uniref:G_PROTEIN_RECEP_F1_2 domain-containing protein n=1 Tax=Steinernema glaseri TaxID=37863 RepID=A0A1I8AT56_9BILA